MKKIDVSWIIAKSGICSQSEAHRRINQNCVHIVNLKDGFPGKENIEIIETVKLNYLEIEENILKTFKIGKKDILMLKICDAGKNITCIAMKRIRIF